MTNSIGPMEHALQEVAAYSEPPRSAPLGVHADLEGVYVQSYVPTFYTWREWDELVCKVEAQRAEVQP